MVQWPLTLLCRYTWQALCLEGGIDLLSEGKANSPKLFCSNLVRVSSLAHCHATRTDDIVAFSVKLAIRGSQADSIGVGSTDLRICGRCICV